MINNKFILEDMTEVFPGYLDKEQRTRLKERFKDKRGYMRCGCKPTEELFYRISEDLKIYPEHNNYVHDMFCSRYVNEEGKKVRQTAYVINEEDGTVKTYLSFNIKEFDLDESVAREQKNEVPEENEDIEEIVVEQSDEVKPEKRKKEPKMGLSGLIRSINIDTFSEKVLTNKKVSSLETFNKMVFHRMKKIEPNHYKKPIGELSLEKDGVRFIYLPFAGYTLEEKNGFKKCYIETRGADGKVYKNFTYPELMEAALDQYYESYGQEPGANTMIGGFQYLKKGRSGSYRVIGRIHLFEVSQKGMYCRSLLEQNTFNVLHDVVDSSEDIKFWIPPEDPSVGGFIEMKGYAKQIMLIFKSDKTQHISYEPTRYVPFVMSDDVIITETLLRSILEE